MIEQGTLDVRLTVGRGEVLEVDLRSTRPRQVAGMLAGRRVEDALRMAPLLFSLCGTAHGLAVALAAERAAELDVAPAQRHARALLALTDMIEGHGWSVLLDWPKLIGEPARAKAYAELRRYTEKLRGGLYPDGDALVFGGGRLAPDRSVVLEAIRGIEEVIHHHVLGNGAFPDDATAFREWVRRGGTTAARLVDRVFVDGFAALDRDGGGAFRSSPSSTRRGSTSVSPPIPGSENGRCTRVVRPRWDRWRACSGTA